MKSTKEHYFEMGKSVQKIESEGKSFFRGVVAGFIIGFALFWLIYN